MTPDTVKTIRLSLRTSRGKPPSQKKLAEFLRMGNITIARYESGAQQPTGTSIHLLRLCQSPEAVKLMAIHNQRDGLFSDIEAGRDCVDCGGYLIDKTCRDCGEWQD